MSTTSAPNNSVPADPIPRALVRPMIGFALSATILVVVMVGLAAL
jgi:hypothetical protein